ncbi:hypothetical protein Mapa_015567 [Marchantia paleacea]|nr:hypothetical protein Mapa_015567 [Marchantia paleacea]
MVEEKSHLASGSAKRSEIMVPNQLLCRFLRSHIIKTSIVMKAIMFTTWWMSIPPVHWV